MLDDNACRAAIGSVRRRAGREMVAHTPDPLVRLLSASSRIPVGVDSHAAVTKPGAPTPVWHSRRQAEPRPARTAFATAPDMRPTLRRAVSSVVYICTYAVRIPRSQQPAHERLERLGRLGRLHRPGGASRTPARSGPEGPHSRCDARGDR